MQNKYYKKLRLVRDSMAIRLVFNTKKHERRNITISFLETMGYEHYT